MKKILAGILALGIILGVGSAIENTVNQVTNTTTTHDEAGGYTTDGEPPIGI
jgi:hypothetical protein